MANPIMQPPVLFAIGTMLTFVVILFSVSVHDSLTGRRKS